MRIDSRGSAVRAVQSAPLAKGYDLPRWGADGRLGRETWLALADFAGDHALARRATDIEAGTGPVPPRVGAVFVGRESESPPAPAGGQFVDIVPERNGEPPPKTKRHANGSVVHRATSAVTGRGSSASSTAMRASRAASSASRAASAALSSSTLRFFGA